MLQPLHQSVQLTPVAHRVGSFYQAGLMLQQLPSPRRRSPSASGYFLSPFLSLGSVPNEEGRDARVAPTAAIIAVQAPVLIREFVARHVGRMVCRGARAGWFPERALREFRNCFRDGPCSTAGPTTPVSNTVHRDYPCLQYGGLPPSLQHPDSSYHCLQHPPFNSPCYRLYHQTTPLSYLIDLDYPCLLYSPKYG